MYSQYPVYIINENTRNLENNTRNDNATIKAIKELLNIYRTTTGNKDIIVALIGDALRRNSVSVSMQRSVTKPPSIGAKRNKKKINYSIHHVNPIKNAIEDLINGRKPALVVEDSHILEWRAGSH